MSDLREWLRANSLEQYAAVDHPGFLEISAKTPEPPRTRGQPRVGAGIWSRKHQGSMLQGKKIAAFRKLIRPRGGSEPQVAAFRCYLSKRRFDRDGNDETGPGGVGQHLHLVGRHLRRHQQMGHSA